MIETAYGPLSVPDWPDDLIVKALRLQGEWALSEQIVFSSLLRDTDVMLDVGGFLGTFGLGATQRAKVPPARLITLEPNPAIYEHLKANLEQNAPCPIDIVPFAIARNGGTLEVDAGSGDRNAGGLSYHEVEDEAAVTSQTVKAISLQELRAEFGPYEVAKLDVEGMETEAILGDMDFIRETKPVIWAECNESQGSIELLEALSWLGYEPIYVAFPAARMKNFKGSDEPFLPMAYEAALLAAPPDRLEHFVAEVEGEDIISTPVTTSFELRKALWSTPRWSEESWARMNRAELIALLGRRQIGSTLDDFLAGS